MCSTNYLRNCIGWLEQMTNEHLTNGFIFILDAALQQQATTGESGNLFDSAKDTVLSIVKNVLNTHDTDSQKTGIVMFS